MKNWENVLVAPNTPILKTIEIIDHAGLGIALVVNSSRKLLGTVTDGDIRRGILRGINLSQPVDLVMNQKPMTSRPNEEREEVIAKMKAKWRHRIPVIDDHGCVISLLVLEEMIQSTQKRNNWVVLMAGGLGSRLGQLTENCPKPLLRVGDKPILETIVSNFIEMGFHKFYIAVNYKAEMIQDHFGDGSKWGVTIKYLREKERLGTAGALGLLPEMPIDPIVVMNGDLLTKVNFDHLINFHRDYKAKATMGVREYDFQVPYGVVKLEKEFITSIDEKPVQRFFVNGGIYVIDPEALKLIPKNTFFDMPELFGRMIEQKKKTAAFPIREYWLDIGRTDDFERANGDYSGMFSGDSK